MARSGDLCNQKDCDGYLKTYKTRPLESIAFRKRWLECSVCGNRPKDNTMLVPLAFAPRFHRRRKQKRIF